MSFKDNSAGHARSSLNTLANKTADASVSWQSLRVTLQSPLVRRVSLLIFASIVVIEAVLLWFSYFTERERQLERMDDAVSVLAPLLLPSNSLHQLDLLLGLSTDKSIERPGAIRLLGYSYTDSSQTTHDKGLSYNLASLELATTRSERLHEGAQFYDTGVTLSDGRFLLTRLEASQVSDMLSQYVMRIIFMVILISVFVTLTCVIALRSNFLLPVINLKTLMRRAREIGLNDVEVPHVEIERTDEIGSVYRSFEQLRLGLISSQAENAEMRDRFQQFAELGADCFWEIDERNRLIYLAGDMQSVVGLSNEELLHRTPNQLDSLAVDWKSMLVELHKTGHWEGQFAASDDEIKYLRVRALPIFDSRGIYRGARGTLLDATESAAMSRRLAYQASHDELTGLINRREFDLRLQSAFEMYEKTQNDCCVLMLDLDRFKQVNDSCGHVAGDILLQQIAELIRFCVRESDTVARFGGDEFSLILHGCGTEKALEVAEKLRESIDDFRFKWGSDVFELGVSIGVAKIGSSMAGANDVLLGADSSCYKAKNLGRNRVVMFDPEDEAHLQQKGEMEWMKKISEALENGSFELQFQCSTGLSAAAQHHLHIDIQPQMVDSEGTVYAPDVYMPAAERFSLETPIDRFIVTQTLQWLSQQNFASGDALTVTLQISNSSLEDPVFHDFLIDRVKAPSGEPGHLCFEFSESAVFQHTAQQGTLLRDLKLLGCKISIHDFGCGFSSMASIQKLPLDYLKIGGSFVENICGSPLDQALMRSMSEVAEFLDLQTIARQVSDEETRELLREFGIDYIQGLFSHAPESLEQIDGLQNLRARIQVSESQSKKLDASVENDQERDSGQTPDSERAA